MKSPVPPNGLLPSFLAAFADEKFNFELLERTIVLNRQPLLHPQPLGLSPAEELTVRDNLQTFQRAGFDFKDGPDGRLLLAAIPFSKGVTFGPDDVLEMVGMLESEHGAMWRMTSTMPGSKGSDAGSPSGPIVHPSK